MGSNGKIDVSDSRSSALKRAATNASKGGNIVTSIDDFYRKQKADKVGASKKKGEAADILRGFRGSSAVHMTKKESIRNPVLMQRPHDLTAANRAAAALYTRSDHIFEAGVVKNLTDFYSAQKFQRQCEARTRKKTIQLNNHRYTNLSSNVANLHANSSQIPFSSLEEGSPLLGTTNEESSNVVVREGETIRQRQTEPGQMAPLQPGTNEILPSSEEDAFVEEDESGRQKKNIGLKATTSNESCSVNVDDMEHENLGVANVENVSSKTQTRRTIFDFRKADYRGFVFVVHEQHGLLLLHCTRKKKKGPHHQLPGGHIDEPEFLMAAKKCQDAHAQLIIAAQAGAARELYEETGIDVRDKVYRLEPAALRNEIHSDISGKYMMTCELKRRLYFFLQVTDEDFLQESESAEGNNLVAPSTAIGSNLRLKLSIEHSGFEFEKNPERSAELLKQHSGGNGSKALMMAMQRDKREDRSSGSVGKEEEVVVEKSNVDLVVERSLDLDPKWEADDNSPVDLLPAPKRIDVSRCWKFCLPCEE